MPGKLCDGLTDSHYKLNPSKAYCEGRGIAANGGTSVHPVIGITGVEGDDNAIEWLVKQTVAGKGITVALIDPDANDAALSVVINGITIKVYLATGPAGAITSTATEVYTAVNAAADLVVGSDEGNSDGTGVVVEEDITLTSGDNPHNALHHLAVDWERGFTSWTTDPTGVIRDCCDHAFGGGFT